MNTYKKDFQNFIEINAYELANEVEMWGEDLLALNMKGGISVTQGAKLLRQQADKIAELEKQLETQGKLLRAYAEKQTKPLSDEEIKDFIYPNFVLEDGSIHMPLDEFLATVRAIEAKVRGEK